MRTVGLGAWRLANETIQPIDVVRRGQIGRYYDMEGNPRLGLVDSIEQCWREATGRPSLAISSASHGLYLSLRILGVEGGEVLLPAYSFAACAVAIRAAGAVPVPLNSGPRMVPDSSAFASRADSQTSAVMAVHMRGIPVDVSAIRESLGPQVPIIEDCSQMEGYGGGIRFESGEADISVYSLQARKLVTAGEGGVMTFAEQAHWSDALQAVDSAWYMRQIYSELPWSGKTLSGSRMAEANAALAVAQLDGIHEFCVRLCSLRRDAEVALGSRALLLSLPEWEVGGVLAISDADDVLRERLSAAGFAVFDECGDPSDPHRSSGWPRHLGSFSRRETLPLDAVALVQVHPAWTVDAIETLTRVVETSLPRRVPALTSPTEEPVDVPS